MTTIDTPNKLPSVDRLLRDPNNSSLISHHGTSLVIQCIKSVLSEARKQVLAGEKFSYDSLLRNLSKEIARAAQPSLRPVINLTGTVLHTNLGRAALPDTAINAMA
ncbi:MAG: L-seryl-tRNA(Sec) selenium transferase, partial [Aestuariivita sp.]|nr:L-seryl-tRNA(Sec) selenium transferase [Aestuariivita sp.]